MRRAIQLRPNDVDTLLVTFRDSLGRDAASMRRFPRRFKHPDSVQTISPLDIADALQASRDTTSAPLDSLLAGAGAQIIQHYWLVQAALVRMRLRAVDTLAAHPAVRAAAAFAVPDARFGEDIVAAVALECGAGVTPRALREWMLERLAPYKVPRRIWFLDELPRTASGKVQRGVLAEWFLAGA